MLIDLARARDILYEAVVDSVVPMQVKWLRPDGFHLHGHFVAGNVAIRGVKMRGKWRVEEDQVRRAAQNLRGAVINANDEVPVELHWESADDPYSIDWRGSLAYEVLQRASRAGMRTNWQRLAEAGNQRAVTRAWGRLLASEADFDARWAETKAKSPSWEVATVAEGWAVWRAWPATFLRRERGQWVVPRGLADFLEARQAEEERVHAAAQRCSRCGEDGGRAALFRWREAAVDGWVTMCPDCVLASYPAYTGRMRGVVYGTAGMKAARPDEYLCALCGKARAVAWDHCHDHRYLRAPICASCNASEWSNDGGWLAQERGLVHLLECTGCRGGRTLPGRYRAHLARELAQARVRTKRCAPVFAFEYMREDGKAVYSSWCSEGHAHRERAVDLAEFESAVAEFVGAALPAGASG